MVQHFSSATDLILLLLKSPTNIRVDTFRLLQIKLSWSTFSPFPPYCKGHGQLTWLMDMVISRRCSCVSFKLLSPKFFCLILSALIYVLFPPASLLIAVSSFPFKIPAPKFYPEQEESLKIRG
jgi:hypothetical protein